MARKKLAKRNLAKNEHVSTQNTGKNKSKSSKNKMHSQSAMEFLMTYGWALLIIAVILISLFELGIFNVFFPNTCVASVGFECNTVVLSSSGLLSMNIAQAPLENTRYTITGISCSNGNNLNFVGVNYTVATGQVVNVATICNLSGNSASGSIWIQYNTPYASNQIAEVGKFFARSSQPALTATFNGKTSSISVPDKGVLNVGNPNFTFSAWVNVSAYPPSPNGNGFPLSSIIFELEPAYGWGISSTGILSWIINEPGNAKPTSATVPLNKWTNIVVTSNGKNVLTYENGVYIGSLPGANVTNYNATSLVIGARSAQGTPYTYFNGSMVNLQIYAKTLSSSQVLQLYKEGIYGGPLDNASIAAWWLLSGSTTDYSGNGNNGTTTNINYTKP